MRALVLSFLGSLSLVMSAQVPVVDITMVPMASNSYEVRIRPDADFDGVFSGLVFTVRWSVSPPVTLGGFQPTQDMMNLGVFPFVSGGVLIEGEYRYARYVAESLTSLAAEGMRWRAGEEVVLGTIQLNGGAGDAQLVNDAWTAEYNGDFYASLNGTPSTGVIYGISTTVSGRTAMDHQGIEMTCLPMEQGFGLGITSGREQRLGYEVLDAIGRSVASGRLAVPMGRSVHGIELPVVPTGMYTVRVGSSTSAQSARVMLIR